MGAVVVTDVVPAYVSAVPAIRQHGAHCVEALLKLFGDIERVVVDANPVVRPAGREIGVADLPAVEIEPVVTEGRGVHRRAFDGLFENEAFAQELGGRQEQLRRVQLDFAPGPGSVRRRDGGVFPGAGIEVRRHPVRRAGLRRPPRIVGNDDRGASVGVLHVQHGQDARWIGAVALVGRIDRDDVLARRQVVLDVDDEGLFEVPAVANRPAVDV